MGVATNSIHTKVVHTNSIHGNSTHTKVVHTNRSSIYVVVATNSTGTKVLSLFYHQSGIFLVALVAKPQVASQYHFNENPHTTITDDTVSHHVIMVIFVLLTTGSIQKTVPSVGWYILPLKWQK